MSVLENAIVGSYFGYREKRDLIKCKVHAEEILSLVLLADKKVFLASQLTLGERKKLELARALSTGPSILLLDEVVAGLNPTETLEMMELIKKIRETGITILMIEHVMKAVMGVSDRIIVLNYGKKIADGKPEAIADNKDVIKSYLGGEVHAQSE
jgi:branched-chain amino acid transport system ATP-binding protein